MRQLALSTVRKGFAALGFTAHQEPSDRLRMGKHYFGTAIYVEASAPGWQIKCSDARWKEAPNVHIVSYFRWPETGAELAKMLDEIRRIYTTLCGVRFPCETCNGTGLVFEGIWNDCPDCWTRTDWRPEPEPATEETDRQRIERLTGGRWDDRNPHATDEE